MKISRPAVETKSEKLTKENKSFKNDISESNSELKAAKKELKNLEKEKRDTDHDLLRKLKHWNIETSI